MTVAAALAALLEPTRLQLAGHLASGVHSTADLQAEFDVKPRAVLEALAALQQAGLAVSTDAGWTIPAENLRSLAAAAADAELPMDPYIGFGMLDEERTILSRYFEGRTLVEVPSSRAKRRIVLERLALEFDIGQRYDESSVNDILHAFHEDHVTLRRYLIDEGLLDRDDSQYWRSGGRVET
jgi:hypothetical protein